MDEGVIGKDEQVVCILTGHELKDANATVKYHTGIDMKAAQDLAPREPATGKWANQPIQVEDDLATIIKAIGAEVDKIKTIAPTSGSLPVTEY
jgi:threonine synthase